MKKNKIIPCIWLTTKDGSLSQVLEYYKTAFGKNLAIGKVNAIEKTSSGHTEICEIELFGLFYSLMSTEKLHQHLNDSISFTIYCEDQKEIDHYWKHFTEKGEEIACGWCNDMFGIRWQVLPFNFENLLKEPKAFKVMMGQKKIIIDEYS